GSRIFILQGFYQMVLSLEEKKALLFYTHFDKYAHHLLPGVGETGKSPRPTKACKGHDPFV
ncbi:MAG TPA: hypothetical protein VHD63_29030, partial [Ktedonobacteraceae bacterium]|nr:hypothetical protein [Ktedonobacteraceae bacterium]